MNKVMAATVVVLFASWTSNALAGNSQSTGTASGTIHFYGSIVESLCDSSIEQNQLQVSCYRGGATKTSTLALNNTSTQTLPYNVGKTQVRWIDNAHKLGIVTFEYQ